VSWLAAASAIPFRGTETGRSGVTGRTTEDERKLETVTQGQTKVVTCCASRCVALVCGVGFGVGVGVFLTDKVKTLALVGS
jgi:hypothetical protein